MNTARGTDRFRARLSHMKCRRIGLKPVVVGMMHGLAGTGALTLLVLTQISSWWIGLLYVATFGAGSIAGMLLMSGLIGLPFALTARSLTHAHQGLQTLAAILSICFGVWYAYEIITSLRTAAAS